MPKLPCAAARKSRSVANPIALHIEPAAQFMTEHQNKSNARLPDAGTELSKAQAEIINLHVLLASCREQASEQALRDAAKADELRHRARNTMTLIRSAFGRTMETGKSLQDAEMHFCGRLDVLAHYMWPVTGRVDGMADVESVLRDELRNFQYGDASNITISGPELALRFEQAQPFALLIHELVTNALKFGALSIATGKLTVTWENLDQCFELTWLERDVPIAVSAPVHLGFGRELIEDALPYQLGATTSFALQTDGLVCKIKLPLSSGA